MPPACVFFIVGTGRTLPFSLFFPQVCFYAPSWVNPLGTQYVGLGGCLLNPAHKYTVLEPPVEARDGEGLSDVVRIQSAASRKNRLCTEMPIPSQKIGKPIYPHWNLPPVPSGVILGDAFRRSFLKSLGPK